MRSNGLVSSITHKISRQNNYKEWTNDTADYWLQELNEMEADKQIRVRLQQVWVEICDDDDDIDNMMTMMTT